MTDYQQNDCLADARAALTAALAVAEEAGAGVFVVPVEVEPAHPDWPQLRARDHGFNACRAATLAGRVTL